MGVAAEEDLLHFRAEAGLGLQPGERALEGTGAREEGEGSRQWTYGAVRGTVSSVKRSTWNVPFSFSTNPEAFAKS